MDGRARRVRRRDLYLLPTATFPKLRDLPIIDCGLSPLTPLLASIEPSNLPALEEITVVPWFGDHDPYFSFIDAASEIDLDSLLRAYKSRIVIARYYDSDRCLWPEPALDAKDLASNLGVRLDATPISPYPRPAFYLPRDAARTGDLDIFEQPVADIMDFLASWYQRVNKSKSVDEYGYPASALKLVKLERVAQTA